MLIIREIILIVLPVVIGGIIHSWVIATNRWPQLRIPLDGGFTWRGQRIFGDNKTVRGAIVMIFATTLASGLISLGIPPAWKGSMEFFQHFTSALTFGLWLGAGYILAELPNSFIKRRLSISPGQRPSGIRGRIWSAVDQADSVIGVCVVLAIVYRLPSILLLGVLIVGITTHLLFDQALYRTGIKQQAET